MPSNGASRAPGNAVDPSATLPTPSATSETASESQMGAESQTDRASTPIAYAPNSRFDASSPQADLSGDEPDAGDGQSHGSMDNLLLGMRKPSDDASFRSTELENELARLAAEKDNDQSQSKNSAHPKRQTQNHEPPKETGQEPDESGSTSSSSSSSAAKT